MITMKNNIYIAWLLTVMFLTAGCAGTRQAYDAADTLEEQAYVVTEHYAALVNEAANLAESGALNRTRIETLQDADTAARQAVLGLAALVTAYNDTRNAETQEALQRALGEAVVAVANFINIVKGAN